MFRRSKVQAVPVKTSRRRPRAELDGPWKEALERFLPDFLALFQPRMHEAIDWNRRYESLDSEFQRMTRAARVGGRRADKLFRVWRKDGEETWLLIHIEVQARKELGFAERMFVYSYHIYNRYRRPVVSLAVLCDADSGWRPDSFGYTLWGSSVDFRFLTVKLLDHWSDVGALESSPNPFAAFVLAHLKAIETRRCPARRWEWKLRLLRGLYDRGLKPDEVRELFRLVDWMMQLPEELEREFLVEIRRVEEERCMPYVTSVERLARKDGLEEGRNEGRNEGRSEGRNEGRNEGRKEGKAGTLVRQLARKFGRLPAQLEERVLALRDEAQLDGLLERIITAGSLDEMRLDEPPPQSGSPATE